MSVRFDASGEHYSATNGSLGTGDFTYLCWLRVAVDRNDFSTFIGLDNNTQDQTCTLQTGSNGTTLTVWLDPSTSGGFNLAALTVGTWYRAAVTRSGTTITGHVGAAGAALTTVSDTLSGTFTGSNFRIGTSVLSEWANGNVQNVKVYSAALTVAEIEAEWASHVPVRTDSLVRWHPLLDPSTVDYSGNGNTLTAAGSPTTEAGPPVPWSPPAPTLLLPAFSLVDGAADASLGALSATVAGARDTAGAAAVSLGSLTAAVEGTGTPPPLEAAAVLGALTATATGTRETFAAVAAPLGGLTATAAGLRTVLGAADASLGGLTAALAGRTTVDTTTLTAAAVTHRTRHELWCVARIMSTSGPPTLLDVDPIEWSGLSWTDELSRPQTLQASVAIPSLPESIVQRLQDMANLPSELHLYRNGRLVFAGQWIGALAQGETLTLNAMGLLGYLRYREIGVNQTFSQVDQAQIVKTLIDQTQDDPWSHFGLDTSGIVDTGQARDATYRVIDGNNLAQRIEEMGRRDFGFDIEVDPQTRQVLLWHPRKGVDRSEGESAIVFDARNVTDPTVAFSVAPGDVATITIAVGTSDKEPVIGFGINAELGSRFGVAHVAERFDGVSEQLTIDDHAWAMLDARDQALIIPGPDVRVDDDTDLDLWAVGDIVAYEPNDTLGIRGAWRVRKRTVKVDQSGQETVTVEFA